MNNLSENTNFNTKTAWPAVDRTDALYSSFFENSHSVMLIIDPESGRILDANQTACTFYGYGRDQILRMRITDINTLSPEAIFWEMERAKNEKRHAAYPGARTAHGHHPRHHGPQAERTQAQA